MSPISKLVVLAAVAMSLVVAVVAGSDRVYYRHHESGDSFSYLFARQELPAGLLGVGGGFCP